MQPTSSKATTVMVLGIVSLVMFFAVCGLGVIPAIIALVMARGAEREIAASGGALQGASQVKAGKIMAWITLGLTALGRRRRCASSWSRADRRTARRPVESLTPRGAFDLRASAG